MRSQRCHGCVIERPSRRLQLTYEQTSSTRTSPPTVRRSSSAPATTCCSSKTSPGPWRSLACAISLAYSQIALTNDAQPWHWQHVFPAVVGKLATTAGTETGAMRAKTCSDVTMIAIEKCTGRSRSTPQITPHHQLMLMLLQRCDRPCPTSPTLPATPAWPRRSMLRQRCVSQSLRIQSCFISPISIRIALLMPFSTPAPNETKAHYSPHPLMTSSLPSASLRPSSTIRWSGARGTGPGTGGKDWSRPHPSPDHRPTHDTIQEFKALVRMRLAITRNSGLEFSIRKGRDQERRRSIPTGEHHRYSLQQERQMSRAA